MVWRVSCSVVVAMWACKAPERTPDLPPDLVPIVAKTGPLELLPDDGEPTGIPVAEYAQRAAAYKQHNPTSKELVLAEHFPPELSPAARAGNYLPTGHALVSWVVDGDAQRGYSLIYDENANGDLRDDARHTLTAHGDAVEFTVATTFAQSTTGHATAMNWRFRVRDGHVYLQSMAVRGGTITVGGRARPFILAPNGGAFNDVTAMLVLDIDGDGTAGPPDPDDSPEAFRMFEHTLTIGGRSYDFTTDRLGSALTLTPRPELAPPRHTFAVGTAAPELAGRDLNGQPVSLSSLRGHTVLIDFWATSCPPCRAALPKLADLYRRRHADGLDILAIIGGDRDEAVKLLGAAPYPGHEVFDSVNYEDAALTQSYRVNSFPTYFIVAPDGKITCARCELDDVLAKLDHTPS